MIITRTPFRVSLFGGGTDYPAWYREHGGAVLGFTIDKYCYIFLRRLPPFFPHRHRVVYSQIELPRAVEEIRHPAVRAVMSELAHDVEGGLEIQHMGDLPARSGLGSSSSFTVGLINAIYALKGRIISAGELAREAIRIEQDVIKEAVGSQDQAWAAYGGFAKIEFATHDAITYQPIIMSRERQQALNSSFMLFFTGQSRFASQVATAQIKVLDRKTQDMKSLRQIVDAGMNILQQPERPLDELGRLLDESWQLKRGLTSSVSSDSIDEIYSAGRKAGAIGGKLLGAGGGGFMLFYARPEHHEAIRQRLKSLIEVRFQIASQGSMVVQYEPA